jgi:hypothetical protein
MSTKRNTTTATWGAALIRALACTPWMSLMVAPSTFAAPRDRSDA